MTAFPSLFPNFAWNSLLNQTAIYTEQEHQLKKEAQKKEELLEKLQTISSQLALYAYRLDEATQKTQTLLLKPAIQDKLPNKLTSTKCLNSIKQLEEVLLIAQLAQVGGAIQKTEQAISDLNKKCGDLRAECMRLEEQIEDFDHLIKKMETLVKERKKTLEHTKKIAEKLIKKSVYAT